MMSMILELQKHIKGKIVEHVNVAHLGDFAGTAPFILNTSQY